MDFWNTRMGYDLANALTRYLPTLAKGKQQTAIVVETDPIADDIMSAINNGKATFAGTFTTPQGKTIVVLEERR